MSIAFLDSASVLGVLFALKNWGRRALTEWEEQCLYDVSYFLLHSDVQIIPGPWTYKRFSGTLDTVFARLPNIKTPSAQARHNSLRFTKSWIGRNPNLVRKRFDNFQADSNFAAWSEEAIGWLWPEYCRLGHGLFSVEFLPQLSTLLGLSEDVLVDIHALTTDEVVVSNWLKSDLATDEAKIAKQAFTLSTLIRGRCYEHVAKTMANSLIPHPFRDGVRLPTETPQLLDAPMSHAEDMYVRIMIGSALQERSTARRAEVWVDNVMRSRNAIEREIVTLTDSTKADKAEQAAIDAAKLVEIPIRSKLWRTVIDYSIPSAVGVLLGVFVMPWAGLIVGAGAATHRHLSGRGISERVERLRTNRKFQKLARRVPGRIVRRVG